jgi:MFS transporter, DHA1 family, inner membrane transport protein
MSAESHHKPASEAARPWWPAALLVLVQIANGVWYMPQLSFFPIYLQERLDLSPVLIASIVSGAQISGMIAALVGGAITGLLSSKWALVWGLILSGIGVLAFQVHTPWLVAVLWFIGGAGLSFITVGGASYLTALSGRASLGILAALFSLSVTVGGVLGNPAAGLLIERSGFSAFGFAELMLIVLTTLFAARFLVYLNDRSPQSAPLAAILSGPLAAARQPKIRMLIGLRSLPTIFYGMMTILIPLLLNDLSGSKTLVAAYGTANLIVASTGQLVSGRAADRWGARIPTLVVYTVLVASGAGLALTAGTTWGLFVFGVLGVAAAWSLSTLMYVWVADGVQQAERPSAFGLLHAIWCVSMIVGSLLGGWLVRAAPGLPFLVAGALNLASPLLALAFYRRILAGARPGAVEPASGNPAQA